eukprot:TRINITY_DN11399_c0_g1_i1.p1 TRINITY_DN11399_c0_g1~~TRINITY_DN11399_c0_g1_i1.p1  ORF type:complete len:456 (-),score=140.36 TRINITY_DN11399_c0_g1_i1:140-1507(-)
MSGKAGWLTKEGKTFTNWKRRWFVLTDAELQYFKTQDVKKAQGSIAVKEITTVVPSNYKNKQFCLAITTPKRIYYVVADSNADMQSWREALQAALTKAKGGKAPAPAAAAPAAGGSAASGDSVDMGPDSHPKLGPEDFELLQVIGQGSFGTVVQCRYKKDGNIYAMKILNKRNIVERGEVDHTKAEKAILQQIQHPFLMCLRFSFQTVDQLYLVMDFVNGGEMFQHLQNDGTFPNDRSRFYSAEIILGLEYLHSKGIIYRDLKPENLLFDSEGHIKITDFGLSKQGLDKPDDRTKTFCGTPEYLAPEVLQGKDYGKEVDWWSLGTLIYEMLVGNPPFYDEDTQKMYQNKMTAELDIPDDVSPEAADLIRRYLDRNPATRLTDPAQMKAHPWFKGLDWTALTERRLTPPYKPPVTNKVSVDMIGQEFLEMNVADAAAGTGEKVDIDFAGFTYKGGN